MRRSGVQKNQSMRGKASRKCDKSVQVGPADSVRADALDSKYKKYYRWIHLALLLQHTMVIVL